VKQLQKILLNLDATEESQRALAAAVNLSKLSEATIIAVNIVNRNVVAQLSRHSGKSLAEIEIELEENGWRYLYAAEEEAKNAGARIVVFQEQGYPEEILPRFAGEYNADMMVIALSPRSRSDITHGRAVEQILEHSPCAVLVVK
jgi:nucleotide-binding universal stress UspA family protein